MSSGARKRETISFGRHKVMLHFLFGVFAGFILLLVVAVGLIIARLVK